MARVTLREYFEPILHVLAGRPEGLGGDRLLGLAADLAAVSTDERAEVTSTGAPRYLSRAKAARLRLAKHGFVTMRSDDGLWEITPAGSDLLEARRRFWQVPEEDEALPDLRESTGAFYSALPPGLLELSEAPVERVDAALAEVTETVEAELLERLALRSPTFFERVVLELLQAMGYGRPEHTGGSGDGGIDGILIADPLGLERVYVQVKRRRRDLKITPGEIRDFVGALVKCHGTKGVLVTTSGFAESAGDDARDAPGRLTLIDGARLVALMIQYGVGVSRRHARVIPEVDRSFFERD